MPKTVKAYQNKYTGKLYEQESHCVRDEFYTIRNRAKMQLDAFMVHYFARTRNDEHFRELWDTLKTLRELDANFYDAVQRERLEQSEKVVELVRATPAADIEDPALKEAANG